MKAYLLDHFSFAFIMRNPCFMPATEKQNSSSFIRILKQQAYFNRND